MVSNNIIKNCPIVASTFTNAHTMFGPKLACNRLKTVRQNLDRVMMDYITVPTYFFFVQVPNSLGRFDVCERHTILDYQVTWYKVCGCQTHTKPYV